MQAGMTNHSKAHATMETVAKLAGVSLKSVSRVINAEPHVSEKLRAKVEAAIAQLNYVPDTAARSLAGARSFTIGLLLDNPSPHYTIKVQTGVYRACVEHQYHLQIDNIDSRVNDCELEAQLAAILRNSRTDGFILTPPLTDNPLVLDYLDRVGVRYCRIAPVQELKRSPGVVIDDFAAAAMVAERLWNRGHRRFGLVNGPADHGAASRRRDGFLQALEAYGAAQDVIEADGGFGFEGGISAGTELLRSAPRPTAIFAANDDSAAGVMVACSQAGLSIPADISVFGFDDSWVAKSVWPYLTTVYQPIEEMGFTAAKMLLENRDSSADDLKMLDFQIVERASVGPAP